MKMEQLRTVNRTIITFFFLSLVWLLFTFSLDPFSLLLGGIFSFTIAVATNDLFVEKHEKIQYGNLPRVEFFIAYMFVLIWEIYFASFNVAYRVITMRIKPGIVKIKTGLKSVLAQALLANSITLTPGTVTVDLKKDTVYVHWLYKRSKKEKEAARKIKGSYENLLRRIFY